MEIVIVLGLVAAYILLSQAKFSQQRDPKFLAREARRQEIRDRHARWRRHREKAAKADSTGTQECAASSCCA